MAAPGRLAATGSLATEALVAREGGMQELRRGHVRPAGSAVWLAATGSLATAAPVEGEGGRQGFAGPALSHGRSGGHLLRQARGGCVTFICRDNKWRLIIVTKWQSV